jgi:hypothetical protein
MAKRIKSGVKHLGLGAAITSIILISFLRRSFK